MRIVWLAAVVLAGLLVAACSEDDDGPSVDLCASNPAACLTPGANTVLPGETADEEAVAIVRADPAVAPLLAGRVLGESYWLATSREAARPLFGERLVVIDIVFLEETQYTGNVPVASDPCAEVGSATAVPSDHPCRSQPRVYATAAANWPSGTRLLHATVDVDRKSVIDLKASGIPADQVDDLIAFLDQYQTE